MLEAKDDVEDEGATVDWKRSGLANGPEWPARLTRGRAHDPEVSAECRLE